MSYILDALKKSERARALGDVPTLQSPGGSGFDHATGRRWRWLWVLLFIVAVAASALAAWQFARRATEPVATAQPIQRPAPAATVPTRSAPATAPAAPGPVVVTPPRPEGASIPWLRELDASVRKALPALTLNVLSYSEAPEQRFVMIDLATYHEGDPIDSDLRLESIHPDGAVFNYLGQRFRVRP